MIGVARVGRVVLLSAFAIGITPTVALGGGWTVQAGPHSLGGRDIALYGVSCVSASACTAVGYYFNSADNRVALAERWNGTSWAIQSTPNPRSGPAQLNGVSCVSASACTAVGDYGPCGPRGALAERWNGTSWAIQPTPKPPTAVWHGATAGVSCVSASACTAVGDYDLNSVEQTCRWRSGGTGRAGRSSPPPTPGRRWLTCWGVVRVGERVHRRRRLRHSATSHVTLAERWNGTSWTIQPTPNSAGFRPSS